VSRPVHRCWSARADLLSPDDSFSGTLRRNLDPYDELEDEALLEVLKSSGLSGEAASGDGTGTPHHLTLYSEIRVRRRVPVNCLVELWLISRAPLSTGRRREPVPGPAATRLPRPRSRPAFEDLLTR
jgi:hypothetical protein